MASSSGDFPVPSGMPDPASETGRHWRLVPQLIQTSSKVVSVLDERGIIRYQNRVMCRLLDYEADALIGKPLVHLLHPHSKETARASIDRMARQEAKFDAWKLRFYTASGDTIWLEGLASNFLKDPRLGGIMIYWSELTGAS